MSLIFEIEPFSEWRRVRRPVRQRADQRPWSLFLGRWSEVRRQFRQRKASRQRDDDVPP